MCYYLMNLNMWSDEWFDVDIKDVIKSCTHVITVSGNINVANNNWVNSRPPLFITLFRIPKKDFAFLKLKYPGLNEIAIELIKFNSLKSAFKMVEGYKTLSNISIRSRERNNALYSM